MSRSRNRKRYQQSKIGYRKRLENVYICNECGKSVLTYARNEGTTPAMIGCLATKDCEGNMHSTWGNVKEIIKHKVKFGGHTHWFIRPSDAEMDAYLAAQDWPKCPPDIKQHIIDESKREAANGVLYPFPIPNPQRQE